MKKMLKNFFFAGLFAFLVASPLATIATPQTTFAATPGSCESRAFLGFPPWYRDLTEIDSAGDCAILSPSDVGGLSTFIWKIVLNVIEIGLILAGWIALFFILYGGFLFITGGGNASQVEKARKSIFNAVIGLVISMGAIAITNLIFGSLASSTVVNSYGVQEINSDDLLRNVINLVYYVAGIVAVIVIIIAGIMYSTSVGDSGRITRAKNMILYSVIGLVILIAAFAITQFVMDRF
jgi:type IV secretory pathway VirB2 component (pilin)